MSHTLESVCPNSAKPESEPMTAGKFHFITVHAPHDAKDQITSRQARSHAVKQALENKRRNQQAAGNNFRATASRNRPKRTTIQGAGCGHNEGHTEVQASSLASDSSLSPGALDPFQTLPVNSVKLHAYLGDYKARQGSEPVFSVAKELSFQNFHTVFRTGLVDPALSNAVMLSFSFAVNGGQLDRECLGYQSKAITSIRERMSCLDEAASESTIGAILLLAGVEACLGTTSQVQLHIGAVQLLLRLCQNKGIPLTGGIKRAIFWQDLNSFVLAGSTRIVDHTTFAEIQWLRDPFCPKFFQLPPAFQRLSHLLTEEFIEILEDTHAKQCIRNLPNCTRRDMMLMARINNHMASIQSRLMNLTELTPILECCRLAIYICTTMLCCKLWCALVLPTHVSSQLLFKLQKSISDTMWDDCPDLRVWLLCIGGAFVPPGSVREDYVALLRLNSVVNPIQAYTSWPELHRMLEEFIWSDKAFESQVKTFWEESLT